MPQASRTTVVAKDLSFAYQWVHWEAPPNLIEVNAVFHRDNGYQVLELIRVLSCQKDIRTREGWVALERLIRAAPVQLLRVGEIYRWTLFMKQYQPRCFLPPTT